MVEKIGVYKAVTDSLKANGIDYAELTGIMPNPHITKVDEGVALARREGVDLLIPIGGGSCIDTAKCIAGCYGYDGPAWDVILDKSLVRDCLPIIAVPTLAATGSDMDPGAMVHNEATHEKKQLLHPDVFPKYSLLDPEYTYSVPRKQTAFGVADIMSHIMEVYFSKTEGAFLADRIMEAMLRTCVKYGTIACNDPYNYEARANLLWVAAWGCNGFTGCGKKPCRWSVHPMEHEIAAFYNDPHGQGIAILTAPWMRYVLNDYTADMFAAFGVNVLDLEPSEDKFETANRAIDALENLFRSWGIPKNLRESGIGLTDDSKFEIMAEKAIGTADKLNGCVPLSKEDIINIYQAAF